MAKNKEVEAVVKNSNASTDKNAALALAKLKAMQKQLQALSKACRAADKDIEESDEEK